MLCEFFDKLLLIRLCFSFDESHCLFELCLAISDQLSTTVNFLFDLLYYLGIYYIIFFD